MMRKLVAATLISLFLGQLAAAAGRIELELATTSTFPATAQQQWYRLLSKLGADGLRIRQAAAGDKPEIKVAGTKAAPVYRVVGLLAQGNVLHLPGEKFSPRDRGRLAEWLAKLRAEGPPSAGGGKAPFGLTVEQFAAVNADLAAPVAFAAQGLSPAELLDKLAPAWKHSLEVDRQTKLQLSRAEPIVEELQGLASGTAVAYALRSEGLGLLPRVGEGKRPEYAVVKPLARQTTWPVGWPLEDRKPKDVVPDLFETLNAEIDDIPLAEALEAIGGRLKTPVLYDHYALARRGIDVAKTPARFPASKTWYAKIIDKLLFPAGLKGEWRLDDAGKPLLWVTTLRPAR